MGSGAATVCGETSRAGGRFQPRAGGCGAEAAMRGRRDTAAFLLQVEQMGGRLDTTLQSEAAEFLVLGQLLLRGIPSYKAYTRNAGHDLIAVGTATNRSARIEVKSRYAADAHWNMATKRDGDTDFYVYVRLNLGNRYTARLSEPRAPEYFVFPAALIAGLGQTGWKQARLRELATLGDHRDAWELIEAFLSAG